MNPNDFPQAVEMEKKLLSALFMKGGLLIPKIAAILTPDDFYRSEHQMIFRAVMSLYEEGKPVDFLAVRNELQKDDDFQKIDSRYWLALLDASHSTAYAEFYAATIKEKSDLRKLILAAQIILEDARKEILSSHEILVKAQSTFDEINRSRKPAAEISFADFFANHFQKEVAGFRHCVNRKSGFSNLDEQQIFSPGLYAIDSTPDTDKITFCWQLLEQLAWRGEDCIFCSYEMTRLELFSQSVARELFRRNPDTALTAVDIQCGTSSPEVNHILADFADADLKLRVLELQDETLDDLLALLKARCTDKTKAPVVCLDCLQMISSECGIENSVRRLKKFQRDTNTTFLVLSDSTESKTIQIFFDTIWLLQSLEKLQSRKISLKCLKNHQGTNYEIFFHYHSAHNFFEPFDPRHQADK